MVATDRRLVDMLHARSVTREGLRRVPGMGPARVARYGPALLAFLEELEMDEWS